MSSGKPTCLAIGGLDPSGNAGIIVDIRTIHACECEVAAVVTSVTYQNSSQFLGAEHQSVDSVRRQLDAVLSDDRVAAVKTGMLPTAEIVAAVADSLKGRDLKLVIDPVIRSSTGYEMMNEEAVAAMIELLFPIATLLTPNLPEAERLSGQVIKTEADATAAATALLHLGAKAVLIKGGHASGALVKGRDLLFTQDGMQIFDAEAIDAEMRGTGCMLASAIAANLARAFDLSSSVQRSKDLLTRALVAHAREH